MTELLARLRAYAAANPTDVQTIACGTRDMAEIEAYRELARLSARWRRRQNAERRVLRAASALPVYAALNRTIQGMPTPQLDHDPFPLVNRWPLKPASIRASPLGVIKG